VSGIMAIIPASIFAVFAAGGSQRLHDFLYVHAAHHVLRGRNVFDLFRD